MPINKKKFTVNSLSGAIQLVITAVLTFISIPLFIKLLGSEKYGIFSIVSIVGNLSIFANLGLNTSLIKFLSEQGKCKESDYDITVTVFLISLVTIPLTLIAIFFDHIILNSLLNIPGEFLDEAKSLFLCLLCANFLLLIGQTFTAVLDSLNKIYLTNFFQLIYSVCYWGLIIISLLLGYSLKMVGFTILTTTLIWFFLVTFYTLKIWKTFDLSELKSNYGRIIKKQLSYGSKIYLGGLVAFCYEPLTKILISKFIGISGVAYFDIILKIRSQVWSLINKIVYPLFPIISQTDDHNDLKRIVNGAEQKILFLVLPIIVSIFFCTRPFITLWLPSSDIDLITTGVIYITNSFLLFSATVTPNYFYLLSKNKISKTITILCSLVIVNTLVILISYTYIGLYSAIIGNALAIFTSFLISLHYQSKYLNSYIIDSWPMLLKLVFVFCILLISNYLVVNFLSSNWLVMIVIPTINLTLSSILYNSLKLLPINTRFIFSKLNHFQQYVKTYN